MAAKCATQQVIVYHERGETIYNCRVFYRVTVGGCKCKHEQAGAELGQAQLKLGHDLTSTKLH